MSLFREKEIQTYGVERLRRRRATGWRSLPEKLGHRAFERVESVLRQCVRYFYFRLMRKERVNGI